MIADAKGGACIGMGIDHAHYAAQQSAVPEAARCVDG